MFDTHCHLNFSAFKKNLDEVIAQAKVVGVKKFVIPATKLKNSLKAVEIAEKNKEIWAAVGVHPHHVYEIREKNFVDVPLIKIEELLNNKKVVAIGEVGLDLHQYEKTVYPDYQITPDFLEMQKKLLVDQIKLAIKYNKSLILHNREASKDLLKLLSENWDRRLAGRTVFHCCEPDPELLEYAKQKQIFLGVDGDVTFSTTKQEFIKTVPLDLLVLETDSPLLLPEPLRSKKLYPNKPENLQLIASFIANLLKINGDDLKKITMQNACRLFQLPEN